MLPNKILINLGLKIINNIDTTNIVTKNKNRLINLSSLIYTPLYIKLLLI
jgi:hypothetical protein